MVKNAKFLAKNPKNPVYRRLFEMHRNFPKSNTFESFWTRPLLKNGQKRGLFCQKPRLSVPFGVFGAIPLRGALLTKNPKKAPETGFLAKKRAQKWPLFDQKGPPQGVFGQKTPKMAQKWPKKGPFLAIFDQKWGTFSGKLPT